NTVPSGLVLDSSVAGANVTINGGFDDPDALDTHDLALTWGDGVTTTQALAAGATTFTPSHVYSASRTYTVNAPVTEPTCASTTATAQVAVTVPTVSASDVL